MDDDREFFAHIKAQLVWDKELRQELHIECFEAQRTGDYTYAEILRNMLQPDKEQNP